MKRSGRPIGAGKATGQVCVEEVVLAPLGGLWGGGPVFVWVLGDV